MKFETKGIGTTWWIEIFDEKVDPEVEQQIIAHIDAFEKAYSRFIPTSFVSKLNNKKVLRDFPSELFSMISYCQSISELTDFRFNVCSGSIQKSNGYDETYSFTEKPLPALDDIRNGLVTLTKELIQIGDDIVIDLGGIGKGWLIDTIKLIIESRGYRFYSINGGGDIYASSNHGKPVAFYMENPFDTTEYIGTVELFNASFACSSPSRRAWETREGHRFHHLVDASQGKPAQSVQAVFCYGNTGLSADTASTCIFISPEQETVKIAESLEVEYLKVYPEGMYRMSEEFPGTMAEE
jgi:thiamine biosynthesis lipoprotein